MFYYVIPIALLLLIPLGYYVYKRITRILKYLNMHYKRWIVVMLSVTYILLCFNIRSLISMFLLHFIFISMMIDIITYLFHYKNKWIELNVVSLLITSLWIGHGYYSVQTIHKKSYTIENPKLNQDYHFLLLSDIHYDTIQDTKVLTKLVNDIKDQQYDFILLTGDIVDEGTSKDKMKEVFDLLGGLNHRYGIYYTYGNHDLQLYTDQRSYSIPELNDSIKEAGIHLLDDEVVVINHELDLIGRRDASLSGRKILEEYVDLNTDHYKIIADHQPVDYKINQRLGIDLEVSGHTHGGQVFPIGLIIEMMIGPNYGKYTIDQFNGIVSSGIAGWGFPLRTQNQCEYVEIHLVSHHS